MPVRIECTDLSKRFGTTTVLDRVNWTVEPGTIAGLIGASGAGKTTLLRIIAGLESPSAGEVRFAGSDAVAAQKGKDPSSVDHVSGKSDRAATKNGPLPRIGMVFQNLALWPHLTAKQHLRCVLPSLGRREQGERIERVLAETRFPKEAWDRRSAELSGGEAQRLALARALAPGPELLLLDEPLAQVDGPLRAELLGLVRDVIPARGMTAIYVTHHAPEALGLCGRIAVMREGRIEAAGEPEEVYWNPPSLEVAQLTGTVVELPKTIFGGGCLVCPEGVSPAELAVAATGDLLVLRPQQFRLLDHDGNGPWEVTECQPQGAGWLVQARHGDCRLSLAPATSIEPGRLVGVEVRVPNALRPCVAVGRRV